MPVQDREVPGQPGQAAAQQGQAEVVVHRHPARPQGGGAGEDAAGDQQEGDGETQAQQREVVQSHSGRKEELSELSSTNQWLTWSSNHSNQHSWCS